MNREFYVPKGQKVLIAMLDENDKMVWGTRLAMGRINVSTESEPTDVMSGDGMIVSSWDTVTNMTFEIEGRPLAD